MNKVFDQIVGLHPDLHDYLPEPTSKDERHRFPEREFFYKVLFKLHPDTVDELIKQAAEARKPASTNLQEQQWQLAVQGEWMDQLLLYDYTSGKYSISSLTFLWYSQEGQRRQQPAALASRQCGPEEEKAQRRDRRGDGPRREPQDPAGHQQHQPGAADGPRTSSELRTADPNWAASLPHGRLLEQKEANWANQQ